MIGKTLIGEKQSKKFCRQWSKMNSMEDIAGYLLKEGTYGLEEER